MTWYKGGVSGASSVGSASADVPSARYGHALSVLDNNKVYLFGGGTRNTKLNDLFVLDTVSMRWYGVRDIKGDQPQGRWNNGFCELGNHQMVIFGGIGQTKRLLNDIVILDIARRMWRSPTLVPVPIKPSGGSSGEEGEETIGEKTWPLAREYPCICSIPGDDKKLYLFGGRDAKRVFGDLFVIKEVGTEGTGSSNHSVIDSSVGSSSSFTKSDNNVKWEDVEKLYEKEARDLVGQMIEKQKRDYSKLRESWEKEKERRKKILENEGMSDLNMLIKEEEMLKNEVELLRREKEILQKENNALSGRIIDGMSVSEVEKLEKHLQETSKLISEAKIRAQVLEQLQKEKAKMETEKKCVVCVSAGREVTLIPCGHHCCCKTCSEKVSKCPVCHASVTDKVVTFT